MRSISHGPNQILNANMNGDVGCRRTSVWIMHVLMMHDQARRPLLAGSGFLDSPRSRTGATLHSRCDKDGVSSNSSVSHAPNEYSENQIQRRLTDYLAWMVLQLAFCPLQVFGVSLGRSSWRRRLVRPRHRNHLMRQRSLKTKRRNHQAKNRRSKRGKG